VASQSTSEVRSALARRAARRPAEPIQDTFGLRAEPGSRQRLARLEEAFHDAAIWLMPPLGPDQLDESGEEDTPAATIRPPGPVQGEGSRTVALGQASTSHIGGQPHPSAAARLEAATSDLSPRKSCFPCRADRTIELRYRRDQGQEKPFETRLPVQSGSRCGNRAGADPKDG